MKRDNEHNRKPAANIPENDPSKAMDSKKEVEQSPDEKTDQDFPGYPHYPAREDIMDQRTESHRVDMDVENLPNSRNTTGVSQRFDRNSSKEGRDREASRDTEEDDLGIRPGTEADVTEDDLVLLNSTNAEIGLPQNVDNEDFESDLDIPGSELDDESEAIGEEDEENNYYSLGGDRQEQNEEDPYSGPNRGNE